jgi:hypothetical protein
MPKTECYRPPSNNEFSGFVSHVQENLLNRISVDSSTPYNSDHIPIRAFNWSNNFPWASRGNEYGWISFSFIQNPFYITHYQLKQRTDYNVSFLESWVFEGSNDGVNWSIIDRRNNPTGFVSKGQIKLFECHSGNFKHFRITSNTINTVVTIQRIEVYGFYCNTETGCNLYNLFHQSCSTKKNTHIMIFTTSFLLIS